MQANLQLPCRPQQHQPCTSPFAPHPLPPPADRLTPHNERKTGSPACFECSRRFALVASASCGFPLGFFLHVCIFSPAVCLCCDVWIVKHANGGRRVKTAAAPSPSVHRNVPFHRRKPSSHSRQWANRHGGVGGGGGGGGFSLSCFGVRGAGKGGALLY